jgi:hypothetical protein
MLPFAAAFVVITATLVAHGYLAQEPSIIEAEDGHRAAAYDGSDWSA